MPSRLLSRVLFLAMVVALASGGSASIVAGAASSRAAQSDSEIMRSLIDEARSRPSIAGPIAGDLTHAIGTTASVLAGVQAADIYVQARFTNPYPAAEHPWDIGFGFRQSAVDEELRLIVDSGGVWYLMNGPNTLLVSGPLDGLQLNADDSNLIELLAIGNQGAFALNGQFISAVELPAESNAGDVWVGSGFYAEDVVEGETTPFSDFEVWSLGEGTSTPVASTNPPAVPTAPATTPAATAAAVATPDTAAPPTIGPGAEGLASVIAAAEAGPSIVGPFGGDMVQTAGSATTISASIDVQDFFAHVQFVNPTDATNWDYGLAFRDQPGGEHYRLVIDAAGTWAFSAGLEPDLASGTIPNFDSSPGGTNAIDLAVAGDTGAFAVNGEFVANLDTSQLTNSGSVWVGTAFAAANTTDGAVTRYEAFEVWPLVAATPTPETAPTEPAPVAPTAPAVTPEPPADDPVAIFEASRQQARQQPSIAPATSGTLVEAADSLVFEAAAVTVADFYATFVFASPRDAAQFPWDVGIVFRATPETQYRLIVRSSGQWIFALGTDELIDTGDLPGLRTGINETNTLELVVNGDRAFFAVNGEVITELDVSGHTEVGEVALASAFLGDDSLEGGITRYEAFEVWALDGTGTPVATTPADATVVPTTTVTASTGVDEEQLLAEAREQALQPPREAPRSGELVETAGQITFESVDISAQDFYAVVRFQNPAGTGEEIWDYGLAFRFSADDDYRLILRSTGEWGLVQRSVADPIAVGDIAALQLEPGAINTVELVARGDAGVFAVNDQVVATLDLSGITAAGDVNVGSTFIAGDGVSGRSIRYSDLEVVPLDDASAVASEPAATSSPTPPSATPDVPTPSPAGTMAPVTAADLSAAEVQRIFDEARELALQQPSPESRSGQLGDADDASADRSLNLTTADFYARARFQDPGGPESWDYGFVFRLTPEGDYHLYVRSTGEWSLTLHTDDFETIASGAAPSLRTEAGGINTMEVVTRGDIGVLAINGTVVDAFDISDLTAPGDIEIASGFLADEDSLGPAIQYRDFFAVPLDDAATISGSPSPAAATPPATAVTEAQATLEAVLAETRPQPPAVLRPTGTLVDGGEAIVFDSTVVDARDVVVRVAVDNPRDGSQTPFDVGIIVRGSSEGQWRIIIRSSGEWALATGTDAPLASGPVSNLRTAAGETNTFEVVAIGGDGLLVVNGTVAAILDLSAVTSSGSVALGTGVFADNSVEGAVATYRDFAVWTLDQDTPPVSSVGPDDQARFEEARDDARQSAPVTDVPSGELIEVSDDQWFISAGVSPRDFYATVDFAAPRGPGEPRWETLLVFRETDVDGLHLFLRSDNEWVLNLVSDDDRQTLGAGTVPTLRTGTGDMNTLELLATGDTGFLAVNGTVVATLDLSASVAPGSIYFSLPRLAGPDDAGSVVPIQNFQVWTLDAPAVSAEEQGALEAILTETRQQPPATSRSTGTLVESLDRINPDVVAIEARDIVIQAAIENPRDLSQEPFDVGFFFRDSAENYLRLAIRSNGEWVLSNQDSLIDSGTVPNLETAAGAINTIQVVAVADSGLLVINDEVVATLDLSSVLAPGTVSLATGMYTDDTVDGAITTYRDFTVWTLDQAPDAAMPIATVGPTTQTDFDAARDDARQRPTIAEIPSGELVEGSDDQWFMGAGVDLQDFYASVDFENPRGPGESPWEVSVSFRDTVGAVSAEEAASASADDGFYQIYLRSDDEWTVLLSRGGSSETIAAGSVSNLRTAAGDINTMEFLVTGDTGLFAVNGTVITPLDLSGFVSPGDVYINVHGLDPAGTETSVTRFQNFQVWSLDDTAGLAASPVAGTPTATADVPPIPTSTPASLASPVPATPEPSSALTPAEQAELEATLAEVQQQPPAAFRSSGTLVGSVEGVVYPDVAVVDARDIVVRAEIDNPPNAAFAPWDVGIVIRQSDQGSVRITLRSDKQWELSEYPESGSSSGTVPVLRDNFPTDISGPVPNLRTGAGESNTIEVIAVDDAGLLVVNGVTVTTLDLMGYPAGDVSLAKDLSGGLRWRGDAGGTTVDGVPTTYRDFAVWILDPAPAAVPPLATVGPETQTAFETARDEARQRAPVAEVASGELIEGDDGIDAEFAGGDFYATVDFENPRGPVGHPWQVRGGFVNLPGVLVVDLRSDQEWRVMVREPDGDRIVDRLLGAGTTAGLLTEAGQVNRLEILAIDDTGFVAVNGTVITTFDRLDAPAPGFVGIGIPADVGEMDDELIRFQNFQVWSLDDTTVGGASPVAGTQTATADVPPIPTSTPSSQASPVSATPEPLPVSTSEEQAELEAILADVQQQPPAAFRSSGTLIEGIGLILSDATVIEARDVVVRAVVETPADRDQTLFAVGFRIRESDAGMWDIVIRSNGSWLLAINNSEIVDSGPVPNLRTTAGETNTIEVVAVDDAGLLVVNGEIVATLDLAALTEQGTVSLASGIVVEDRVDGATATYQDFAVWTLDEDADPPPPAAAVTAETRLAFETAREQARQASPVAEIPSGELIEGSEDRAFTATNVNVQNFYATVDIEDPRGSGERPWIVQVQFRDTTAASDETTERAGRYYIYLRPDNEWGLEPVMDLDQAVNSGNDHCPPRLPQRRDG